MTLKEIQKICNITFQNNPKIINLILNDKTGIGFLVGASIKEANKLVSTTLYDEINIESVVLRKLRDEFKITISNIGTIYIELP